MVVGLKPLDCGKLVSEDDECRVRENVEAPPPIIVPPAALFASAISSLDVAEIWTRSLFGSVAILLVVSELPFCRNSLCCITMGFSESGG